MAQGQDLENFKRTFQQAMSQLQVQIDNIPTVKDENYQSDLSLFSPLGTQTRISNFEEEFDQVEPSRMFEVRSNAFHKDDENEDDSESELPGYSTVLYYTSHSTPSGDASDS